MESKTSTITANRELVLEMDKISSKTWASRYLSDHLGPVMVGKGTTVGSRNSAA